MCAKWFLRRRCSCLCVWVTDGGGGGGVAGW